MSTWSDVSKDGVLAIFKRMTGVNALQSVKAQCNRHKARCSAFQCRHVQSVFRAIKNTTRRLVK